MSLRPYPAALRVRLADPMTGEGATAMTGGRTVSAAVDAAVAGDGAGWDALFDRFYPVVLRFAMARLGDRSAAEEVTQEVFVAAVASIRSLRERREPAVEAWFLRIARFKIVDRFRRGRRPDLEVPGDLVAADDPAEAATLRMEAAEVRRAMERLTDEQREILVRRFVLDQSLEQVAEATGRPVGAVKSMQHRALAALSRRLGRREAA